MRLSDQLILLVVRIAPTCLADDVRRKRKCVAKQGNFFRKTRNTNVCVTVGVKSVEECN